MDPAIEQQAVARVHRIGQTRETVVTRLLVEGTVEMQVIKVGHLGVIDQGINWISHWAHYLCRLKDPVPLICYILLCSNTAIILTQFFVLLEGARAKATTFP